MKRYISITIIALFIGYLVNAQKVDSTLTIDKAIGIALSNNFDIKIANHQLQQAQNNHSIGNAGLLPSLTANGGAEYQKNDTELQFNGVNETQNVDGAVSISYNGNIRIDYTLFDGFGNLYTLKKLKGNDERQQNLFKRQMEITMLEVIENYYQLCLMQENIHLAKQNLKISNDRYQRVLDQKAFGQATQLDALNAKVDLNTDSTTLLNVEQNYLMAIKNLNVSLGIEIASNYAVSDSFEYKQNMDVDYVINAALNNNTHLISQQQQEQIKDLDFKITRAQRYPSLSAYGQYGYSKQENDAGMLLYSQTNGMTGGLSLRMNIFNGRQQRTKEKNAQLDYLSEQEKTKQLMSEIERDASNAYTDYVYKLKIVDLQKSSIEQAKHNFEQTKEMFQLGRVNSIEFRTAQQNLLSAAYNYNTARLEAKIAEYYLLSLTGDLLQENENN